MSITARTRIGLAVGIVGLGTIFGAGVAGAQGSDPYVAPSDTVQPEVLPASISQSPAAPTESSLAFTGGDAAGLALIGGVAVAAGAAITVSRRRTAAA